MKDILSDLVHAGMGLAKLTKEDIDKVFNELKSRGEVGEEDRDFFITRALEKLEKTGRDLSKTITDAINPNSAKIDQLNAKIDELMREIDALKKRKT
jgi:polyhydroxyalkanoate synthesis regulator phasin